MDSTPATPAVHQVNLLLLLLVQEQGDLASTVGDEELTYDMRETLRSLANWKKHNLCLCFPYYYTYTQHRRSRKERRSLQSLTDDNGTPATWTLVLFQQAIDRQDRTS